MPRLIQEVPTNYDSVLRPVVTGVAEQLCKILRIPEDVQILYPGNAEKLAQIGSTLQSKADTTEFRYKNRFRIGVTETTEEAAVLTTPVMLNDNIPIFADNDLGVIIKPIYSKTELQLSLVYRGTSKADVRKMRDDCIARSAQLRAINVHEITYHYEIPYGFLQLIQDVYETRERVAGYDGDTPDFSRYVREHITPRATNLTTLIGTQPTVAVAETQLCVQGYFDFSGAPVLESKEAEGGLYAIEMTYTFSFDKIIGCAASYPLVVHNQLLPDRWYQRPLASGNVVDPDRRVHFASASTEAMQAFTPTFTSRCTRQLGGYTNPEFDDWVPNAVWPRTSTLMTVMLTVDEADQTLLANLRELGEYRFDADVLTFMASEGYYMGRYLQSIFHCELYRNESMLEDQALVVDDDLDVRAVNALNPRDRLHLRISIVNDLLSLDAQAIDRLRTAGPVALKILAALQAQFFDGVLLPELVGGQVIRPEDFRAIAIRINNLKRSIRTDLEHNLLTVGQYTVETGRISDYAGDADRQTHGADATPGAPDLQISGAAGYRGTLVQRCDG